MSTFHGDPFSSCQDISFHTKNINLLLAPVENLTCKLNNEDIMEDFYSEDHKCLSKMSWLSTH